jgi:PII-like signaling protein
MVFQKMLCLTIRIKRNDEINKKRLERQIIELLVDNKVVGATVWLGVDGFGKRGKSTTHLEGITMNQPLMIEAVDEMEKIQPLLIPLKRMVDDNGMITIHEVNAI